MSPPSMCCLILSKSNATLALRVRAPVENSAGLWNLGGKLTFDLKPHGVLDAAAAVADKELLCLSVIREFQP
jgi:hypothetical protein